MIHGLITRTSTPPNFSKSITPPPLRLDDQMFKKNQEQPPKDSSTASHSSLLTMTDQSHTASIYDYPSKAVSPWNASDDNSQLPDLEYPTTPSPLPPRKVQNLGIAMWMWESYSNVTLSDITR
jgi:hypothetical protein